MVRIKYHESGEIWETDGHLTSRLLKGILNHVRWYRQFFPENCPKAFSQIEIDIDGEMYALVTITKYWTAYVRTEHGVNFFAWPRLTVNRQPKEGGWQ